jgi:hypothetical protein
MPLSSVRWSKTNGQSLVRGIPGLTIVTNVAHLFSGISPKRTRFSNMLPHISFSTPHSILPESYVVCVCENHPCAYSISERVKVPEVRHRLIFARLVVLISPASSCTLQPRPSEPIPPAPMCLSSVRSARRHLQRFGNTA